MMKIQTAKINYSLFYLTWCYRIWIEIRQNVMPTIYRKDVDFWLPSSKKSIQIPRMGLPIYIGASIGQAFSCLFSCNCSFFGCVQINVVIRPFGSWKSDSRICMKIGSYQLAPIAYRNRHFYTLKQIFAHAFWNCIKLSLFLFASCKFHYVRLERDNCISHFHYLCTNICIVQSSNHHKKVNWVELNLIE